MTGLVAAVVIGGFAASDYLAKTTAINDDTLCPTGGAQAAVVILLDLTDPVSSAQINRLRAILGAELARAEAGTMISVGVVSEFSENWGSRFARCKPQQKNNANPLFQNPRLIGERYNDEFIVPFDQTLASLLNAKREDSSPIMEGLQALVAETPEFYAVTEGRKLILVSDLLQNSETLSFYRDQFWDVFSEAGGIRRLSGNLKGVDVMLLRVPRKHPLDGDERVDQFWLRYFDFQGANGSLDVRILGDL